LPQGFTNLYPALGEKKRERERVMEREREREREGEGKEQERKKSLNKGLLSTHQKTLSKDTHQVKFEDAPLHAT